MKDNRIRLVHGGLAKDKDAIEGYLECLARIRSKVEDIQLHSPFLYTMDVMDILYCQRKEDGYWKFELKKDGLAVPRPVDRKPPRGFNGAMTAKSVRTGLTGKQTEAVEEEYRAIGAVARARLSVLERLEEVAKEPLAGLAEVIREAKAVVNAGSVWEYGMSWIAYESETAWMTIDGQKFTLSNTKPDGSHGKFLTDLYEDMSNGTGTAIASLMDTLWKAMSGETCEQTFQSMATRMRLAIAMVRNRLATYRKEIPNLVRDFSRWRLDRKDFRRFPVTLCGNGWELVRSLASDIVRDITLAVEELDDGNVQEDEDILLDYWETTKHILKFLEKRGRVVRVGKCDGSILGGILKETVEGIE